MNFDFSCFIASCISTMTAFLYKMFIKISLLPLLNLFLTLIILKSPGFYLLSFSACLYKAITSVSLDEHLHRNKSPIRNVISYGIRDRDG